MLLVDTVKGELIDDEVLKNDYATRQPYGEWLDSNLIELKNLHIPNQKAIEYTGEERARLQKAFGYTYEDMKKLIGKRKKLNLSKLKNPSFKKHIFPLS